ncbi:MAG: hypothetical protein A2W28_08300 [Gammaproteobacteria bacterium RBG_16_51_14]|nr:MAG: hypothetical protein A2W28_08300 [Gammaproteobacteria bacterium RBG_16_51_14]
MSHPPVLFSAPHRVMFFAGTIQLVLTLLFWCVELVGRYTSFWPPLKMILPGVWAHTFMMVYGLYPFFIFGFLLTTYPRWLKTDPVPASSYTAAFVLMLAGNLLFYPALFISRTLLELAVLALLSGWTIALCALVRAYLCPQAIRTHYELILICLLVLGLSGASSSLAWLMTNNDLYYRFTLTGGVWLFLVPVIITVAHRMIPFFNSMVLAGYTLVRPGWSLPFVGICLLGHFSCTLLELPQWVFVFDLPLAAAAIYHSWLWQFRRSWKVPLLAMLHIAFLWLPVGMFLFAIQGILFAVTGTFVLGKAPVHAIGIGFITSMTLAMAARVSFGHSGRPLVASRLTLTCFWLLQLVTLFRIIGEFPLPGTDMTSYWILTAALVWVLALSVWAWIYVPIYLNPRIDGQPG